MWARTILIAAAALAAGTLLGRLSVPNFRFALAQPMEDSMHSFGGEALRPVALEVPAILGNSLYQTCGAWDDWGSPVILRP